MRSGAMTRDRAMPRQSAAPGDLEAARRRRRAAVRRYTRHPGFMVGATIIALITLIALAAPWIAPNSPLKTDMTQVLAEPSWAYPLGTDQFGRCVLSRLIHGARISLQVGFWVVLISLTFGTLIGALAGFLGGWIERVIVALIDIMLAFPGFLLALALVAAQGSSLTSVITAVSIAYTPRVATVMRSVVLTIRPRPFIEASHAIGLTKLRILLRHVIPNAMPPVIVVATVSAATAILAEAGLSFLGLGVQPPTATWGSVIANGQAVITTRPLISLSAGLSIAIAVIGLNLLGDGLRDTLDPQMRRQTGAKML
ncbi:MAG: ABC transporter permease [Kiloniellales bacterium]|nr:ABC transporter permease [Kiloniellales bacterium]